MLRVVSKDRGQVDFIGGPFDGHSQCREVPAGKLPINIVWLVCNDAFEQLNLEVTSANIKADHASLTSVALYRLDSTGKTEVYRFAGSLSACNFGAMLSGQNPQRKW